MSEKQKDSKIMSMLERKGIIRKADDVSDESVVDEVGLPSPDITPLFTTPDAVTTVKTAPRQPVPGMSTPVFPSDVAQDDDVETVSLVDVPQVVETAPTATETASALVSAWNDLPEQEKPIAPLPYSEPPKPTSTFGGFFRGNNNAPAAPAPAEIVARDGDSHPENYTDRYLNISELYDALALRSKKTDTIYLIEEYLGTLPSSLPDSHRREIVKSLLAASGFDFDLLMGDGVLRVKMLKEYAERFARHTDDYIAARQAELEELNQQILRTHRLIDNRKELHKKQFYTIEAEAQRLKEILTFISG